MYERYREGEDLYVGEKGGGSDLYVGELLEGGLYV